MSTLSKATLISVTATAATVPLWYLAEWYMLQSLPGIEIALALAAGVSFHLAYQEKEAQAGMASASIAITAILIIKIVVFNITVPDGESSEDKLRRIQVLVLSAVLASQQVPDENVNDDLEGARDWQNACDAAAVELQHLSPQELAARLASYRAKGPLGTDEIRYVTRAGGLRMEQTFSLSEAPDADPSGVTAFFIEMWAPIDAFLMLVASGLAFLAGAGGLRHLGRLLGGLSPGEP